MPNPTEMDKAIDEIQEILIKKKGKLFIDCAKTLNTSTTISPVDVDAEEKKELTGMKIKTGTVIDEIIGGGIGVGEMAMLYGEFAAGKTQTVFTIVALSKGMVVYIDSEDSFSFKRLKEICDARGIDYADVKKRLLLYKPQNWLEQLIIARSIPAPEELDGKIDIIIVDSIINYFRGQEFTGRQTLPLKTGFLREFIEALKYVAKIHKAGIIMTNQVSEEPSMNAYSSKADTQKPLGGHSVTHQPTYSLFFRKGSGNIRVVRVIDSSKDKQAERAFIINEKGIDDLPKDAKAAESYEEGAKKFETKMTQEAIPKATPKKKKGGKDSKEEETPETQESTSTSTEESEEQ